MTANTSKLVVSYSLVPHASPDKKRRGQEGARDAKLQLSEKEFAGLKSQLGMNTHVIANIIYSVGLFFNMIGVGFVTWEVIKQYKGKKHSGRDNNITGGINVDRSPIDTAGYKKWTLVKYRYMRIGLILLLSGFGLQIVSNWIN